MEDPRLKDWSRRADHEPEYISKAKERVYGERGIITLTVLLAYWACRWLIEWTQDLGLDS